MAQERFDIALDLARRVEVKLLVGELEPPAVPLPAPTAEEAHAMDQVFADDAPAEERRIVVLDAINLAAAGMLLHDIVEDTLAPAKEEDEEDKKPQADPKGPEPE